MTRRRFIKSGLLWLATPPAIIAASPYILLLQPRRLRIVPSGGGGGGNGLLTGLVAVWEMEAASAGDQTDATGGGRTATHTGSTLQSSTHIQGSFSGSGASNAYWSSSDAAFVGTGSFSVAMWVNCISHNMANLEMLDRIQVQNCYVFQFGGTTPYAPTLYIRNSADSSWFTATSTIGVANSNWHLAVVTYDSSSKVGKVSLDGETLVASATTDGLKAGSSPFKFGLGDFLTDEIAFWSRAISQTDITTLYASGSGFFYSGGGWTS